MNEEARNDILRRHREMSQMIGTRDRTNQTIKKNVKKDYKKDYKNIKIFISIVFVVIVYYLSLTDKFHNFEVQLTELITEVKSPDDYEYIKNAMDSVNNEESSPIEVTEDNVNKIVDYMGENFQIEAGLFAEKK